MPLRAIARSLCCRLRRSSLKQVDYLEVAWMRRARAGGTCKGTTMLQGIIDGSTIAGFLASYSDSATWHLMLQIC